MTSDRYRITITLHYAAGLTKMVSKMGKEGAWRKALEIYYSLDQTGIRPDTAITNAAISACDKGQYASCSSMPADIHIQSA